MERCLRYSIEHGLYGLLRHIVKNSSVNIRYNNDEALYLAVAYNRKKTAKLLIENGADVHTNVEEPLTVAAELGHWEMARLLLESGANIQLACMNLVIDGHIDAMWKLLYLKA